MIRTIAAGLFALGLAGSAFASQCPGLMAEIDAALPNATITAEQRAQVEELRAQGEEHHAAGRHAESEAALNEAKQILGI
jgi:predicted exporter